MKVVWNKPDVIPEVEIGTEKLFWIAIYSGHSKKEHVFLAQYQNRPATVDEDGYAKEDWALETDEGEVIQSVGWVSETEHCDFDGFYTGIVFDDNYKLLGWAEYVPPIFNNIGE